MPYGGCALDLDSYPLPLPGKSPKPMGCKGRREVVLLMGFFSRGNVCPVFVVWEDASHLEVQHPSSVCDYGITLFQAMGPEVIVDHLDVAKLSEGHVSKMRSDRIETRCDQILPFFFGEWVLACQDCESAFWSHLFFLFCSETAGRNRLFVRYKPEACKCSEEFGALAANYQINSCKSRVCFFTKKEEVVRAPLLEHMFAWWAVCVWMPVLSEGVALLPDRYFVNHAKELLHAAIHDGRHLKSIHCFSYNEHFVLVLGPRENVYKICFFASATLVIGCHF